MFFPDLDLRVLLFFSLYGGVWYEMVVLGRRKCSNMAGGVPVEDTLTLHSVRKLGENLRILEELRDCKNE